MGKDNATRDATVFVGFKVDNFEPLVWVLLGHLVPGLLGLGSHDFSIEDDFRVVFAYRSRSLQYSGSRRV